MELKPCPFCGSEAEIWGEEDMVKVRCSNYECMASKIGWFDEPEEAAEDWNRRAPAVSQEEFDPHKTPVGARLDAGLWD